MRSLLLLLGSVVVIGTACVDQGVQPTAVMAVTDSADQVMLGMTTVITVDGVIQSRVEADTAYVYQARNLYDLRRMTITFYDAQGAITSTLSAETGIYLPTGESLDARGTVKWTSVDQLTFLHTEHLIYNKGANQLVGDTTFVYQNPNERLTGNGFVSDIQFTNVRVQQPQAVQRGTGAPRP